MLGGDVCPAHLPLLRVVDPLMAQRMATFVLWAVINCQRKWSVLGGARRHGWHGRHGSSSASSSSAGSSSAPALCVCSLCRWHCWRRLPVCARHCRAGLCLAGGLAAGAAAAVPWARAGALDALASCPAFLHLHPRTAAAAATGEPQTTPALPPRFPFSDEYLAAQQAQSWDQGKAVESYRQVGNSTRCHLPPVPPGYRPGLGHAAAGGQMAAAAYGHSHSIHWFFPAGGQWRAPSGGDGGGPPGCAGAPTARLSCSLPPRHPPPHPPAPAITPTR